MESTPAAPDRGRWAPLAWGAIAGQAVFTVGWLLTGALEGDGYSSVRHITSDLASLTGQHAALLLAAQAVGGVLTILFAIGALLPSLAAPGRGPSLGAWCVAGSLAGAELVTELIFRLDCREVDAGCTTAVAMASWPGKLHVIVGCVDALMTVAAPFALGARMRLLASWRNLARPAFAFGVILIAVFAANAVFFGSPVAGLLNRAPLALASAGVVALALRVRRLASERGAP